MDEIKDAAKDIQAVNCVQVDWISSGQFKLIGYNTDYYGFAQSIKPFLDVNHQRALILGTGGASKAVAYALKQIGVEVFYVTTKEKKAANYFLYDELNELVLQSFKLVVNTTPLGTSPNVSECPNIPYQYITPQHLLYDLIYNPSETLFLQKGKEKGAITVNGLNMLKLQAEKAWEIWNIK